LDLNKEFFIKKAKLKHGDRYDYSLVEYINNKTKVKIMCKEHGKFEQRVDHHLNGAGCPICKESRGEAEIKKFCLKNKIKVIRQHRFKNCRDKKPLPFDFYLPEYNTCIEFNGRQHYISVPYWGGNKNLKNQQIRDKIKLEFCQKNNISLIIINDIKEIIKKLKWMIQ
jgi:hypothetical protein